MNLEGANNALFWSEMYHMLSYNIVSYAIFCYLMVLHDVVLYCIVSYGVLCYLMVSNSIARYCVIGLGALAVSRKTPIYFIILLEGLDLMCIFGNHLKPG